MNAFSENPEGSSHLPDSRYTNAMKKRMSSLRRTIEYDPSAIENDNTVDDGSALANWKNTNRQMYYSNTLYQKLCTLCNKTERYLVAHYSKQHPQYEVVVSRLSPVMADAIRDQSEQFQMIHSKITGICYFCEEVKTMIKNGWDRHILTHTGEPQYICNRCNATFKKKVSHNGCGGQLVSIYAINSADALVGHICKECNYLQISRNRLIDHLKKEHEFDEADVGQHYDKVVLIPDVSHVRTMIKFGYVEAATRFTCTICEVATENAEEFVTHFKENHSQVDEYTCYCTEKVKPKDSSLCGERATQHVQLHGADLFQCILCENKYKSVFFTEEDMLEHLSTKHTDDELKFHHLHRDTQAQDILAEISVKKFSCNKCHVELNSIGGVLDHFGEVHQDQAINVNVLVSKKSSRLATRTIEIESTFSCNQTEFGIRQAFLCTKCDFETVSNEKLLKHHNDKHRLDMPNFGMGGLSLVRIDSDDKFDRSLVYSCYWCNDHTLKFISGNVEAIHKHWIECHIEPTFNPFNFCVEPLAKCNYCDMISTYKGLIEHTENAHRNAFACFVDVNNHEKCLLCDFTGQTLKLPEHFESEHYSHSDVNMLNPCQLMPDVISKLMNIDVHQKFRCFYCEDDYETLTAYEEHHALKHQQLEPKFTKIFDNACKELRPTCCQNAMHPQEFMDHLNRHAFQFSCSNCETSFSSLEEAAKHDNNNHQQHNSLDERWAALERTLRKLFVRTKVFFGHGLVLYKQNLFGSWFDDTKNFEHFLQNKKAHHYKQFNEQAETTSNDS